MRYVAPVVLEVERKENINRCHGKVNKKNKFHVYWCPNCGKCWQTFNGSLDYLNDFAGKISCEDKPCPKCDGSQDDYRLKKKLYSKEYWRKKKA